MSASPKSKLSYRNVTRRFGHVLAVDDVSLEVREGEVIALLGPSGSGKSTLLAMTGGQLAPDSGDIWIDGVSIAGLPPNRIDTATVFQEYALFPHLTVAENIGFGLYMRRVRRQAIAERVEAMLELVGLMGLGGRKVTELSGGQRQRVATARALAVEPRVLLMDEPLSALDREIRKRLQDELSDLLRRLGMTTVIVTHDQEEAFAMADRVAVMHEGRLDQIDAPPALYREPATPFVATFLGSGVLLQGEVGAAKEGMVTVRVARADISCRGAGRAGEQATVLIRAEDVVIDPQVSGGVPVAWPSARVARVVDSGETTRYVLDLGGETLQAVELGLRRHDVGDEVAVGLNPAGPVIVPYLAAGSEVQREG